MEKSKKVRQIIHIVVSALFLAVMIASFVMYAIMATNFFIDFGRQGTGETGGENFGIGIALGFAAVFMIIFGVSELVASLINIPLHIWLLKAWRGKTGDYAKIAIITNAALLLISVVAFVVMIIMTR